MSSMLLWLKSVLVDILGEWMTKMARTPKYSATTKVESAAHPDEEQRVVSKIKNSKLWAAKNKN